VAGSIYVTVASSACCRGLGLRIWLVFKAHRLCVSLYSRLFKAHRLCVSLYSRLFKAHRLFVSLYSEARVGDRLRERFVRGRVGVCHESFVRLQRRFRV